MQKAHFKWFVQITQTDVFSTHSSFGLSRRGAMMLVLNVSVDDCMWFCFAQWRKVLMAQVRWGGSSLNLEAQTRSIACRVFEWVVLWIEQQ